MEAGGPGYLDNALVIENRMQRPLTADKFARIPRGQKDGYRGEDKKVTQTSEIDNKAASANKFPEDALEGIDGYADFVKKPSNGTESGGWRFFARIKRMQQSVLYWSEIGLNLTWIILYCIFLLLLTALETITSSKKKEATEVSEEDKVTGNHNPELSNDESVIIVEEKKVNENYFTRSRSKVNGMRSQYGTSLSTTWRPRYLGISRTPTPRASLTSLFNSRIEDGSELDFFERSVTKSPNEYENYISRFYLPHAPLSKYKYSLVDSLIENFVPEEKNTFDFFPKKRQERIARERETLESKVLPLTPEQVERVMKCWKMPLSSIIVSSFQIDISSRDLQTLREGHWLNDNILDFYFNLITVANASVFCWTTHFFSTLKLRGYQGVARWAKRRKVDLTEKKLIFVPINILSTHWALAVVDNVAKDFRYYDSLSSGGNLQALRIIKSYMIEEGKKQNSPISYETYKMNHNMPSPQQGNGSDCGVFTCISAKFLSRNKNLAYDQRDTKILRQKMAYEIITKQLM